MRRFVTESLPNKGHPAIESAWDLDIDLRPEVTLLDVLSEADNNHQHHPVLRKMIKHPLDDTRKHTKTHTHTHTPHTRPRTSQPPVPLSTSNTGGSS
ncbi:MAG: hypothetical protein ACPIOQ_13405 [Promethearchaeia archaeon]